MKVAILQMADAGPTESTVLMLTTAGYQVYLPNKALRDLLRTIGCDTVLSPRDLTAGMGYDPLVMPEAGPEAMETCDLYCDIKAHRCYDKIVNRWPRLKDHILWVRINGGRPEIVPGCGDEVDPPCPVLTPNLWYAEPGPWSDRSYACWPPFYRFDEYFQRHGRTKGEYDLPICLIHGLQGWGYGALVDNMRSLGVRCYGAGSPDGLIPHGQVPGRLAKALAMVHLKSSDSPGYALYEALAAACPVICTRRLIWRCNMGSLLIPGETCLVFDRETHDGLTPEDVEACTTEVREHLDRLADPTENRRIGMAGHHRLQEVMWSDQKKEDVESLRAFMARRFP